MDIEKVSQALAQMDVNSLRGFNRRLLNEHDQKFGTDNLGLLRQWEAKDNEMMAVYHAQVLSRKASPKSIDRVRKFFNRENVYKQLKTMVSFLIPHKKNVKLKLNIGGGSFTDGKSITIGLPETFIEKSFEEIFTALRALVGHETQHVNSSDFHEFVEFQKDVGEYFHKKYGIAPFYGQKVAKHVANSVEDGRIEKILCNRLPGYLKHIQFLNGSIWEAQEIQGDSELEDFLYSMTTLSVIGLYPKGFNKVYKGTRLHQEIKKIRSTIVDGINAMSCKQCFLVCWDIIKTSEDYLADLLKNRSKEDEEFLRNIPENAEWTTSEESQQNSSRTISTHFKPETKDSSKAKKGSGSKGQKPETDENEEDGSGKDKKNQKSSSSKQSGKEDGEDSSDEEGSKASNVDEEGDDQSESSTSSGDEKSEDAGAEQDNSENGDSKSGDKKSDEDSDDEADGESDGTSGDQSDEDGDESSSGGKADGDGDSDSDSEDSQSAEDGGDDDPSSKPASSQYPEGTSRDDDDDSEIDEEAIRGRMQEITDDVYEDAKDKLQEQKPSKAGKKQEPEEGISEEDLAELESQYRNESVKRFKELKGFNKDFPLPSEIKREGAQFRKEVEKIFRNKQTYTSRNQKRGVLDTGSLWKLGVKDYNMFVQKGVPVTTDYVAFILQDGSGSMTEDEKEFHSAKACAVMEEGLKGIIPFKISTFSVEWYENAVVHYTAKDFGDNSVTKNHAYSFHRIRGATGGNKDGYSIRVATAELLKRPEKDRILIVLSDGLPSDYNGGQKEGMVDVKKAVKEARAKGIHVVSLLFGTQDFRDYNIENYKYMYERNIISSRPEEITNHLLKLLKRIIAR